MVNFAKNSSKTIKFYWFQQRELKYIKSVDSSSDPPFWYMIICTDFNLLLTQDIKIIVEASFDDDMSKKNMS